MIKNDEYLDQFIAAKKDDPIALALLMKFKEIHRDCETSEHPWRRAAE